MCRRVTCDICHKPTWSGCGNHIEAALNGVPPDKRCKCRDPASTPRHAPAVSDSLDAVIRISSEVFIAAQLSDADISNLAKAGQIKSLVNLRDGAEDGFRDESQLCRSLGLKFHHIPVTIATMNHALLDEVLAVIDQTPKPVLVHCASMMRAAAVSVAHGATRGKWSEETTQQLADDVGLEKLELRKFVLAYVQHTAELRANGGEKKAGLDITQPLAGKPEVKCLPHADTATAVYIVHCPQTRKAVIVDPCIDYDAASGKAEYTHADSVIAYVREQKLDVLYCIETHAHADHLTAAQYIKAALGCAVVIGARITEVQQAFGPKFGWDEKALPRDGSQWDLIFREGHEWKLGNLQCKVIATPGHTPACMTWIIGDAAFTGDTIFMPDVGTARCDFPGGSADDLWASIQRILSMPDKTRLFVGHDYPPNNTRAFRWETSVAEQKASNKMCNSTIKQADFIQLRKARDATLTAPRLLLPSIQVNIRAGRFPPAERNGVSYLKIPVTVAPAAVGAAKATCTTGKGTCG